MPRRMQKAKATGRSRTQHNDTAHALSAPLRPKGPKKALKSWWSKLFKRSTGSIDPASVIPKGDNTAAPDATDTSPCTLTPDNAEEPSSTPASAIQESQQLEHTSQVALVSPESSTSPSPKQCQSKDPTTQTDNESRRSSASPSTIRHDLSGRSSALNHYRDISDVTPPSELSSKHGSTWEHSTLTPRLVRRWSSSNMQSLSSDEQMVLQGATAGTPHRQISAARAAQLRKKLTVRKRYVHYDDPSEASGLGFSNFCVSQQYVLEAKRDVSLARSQLQDQQHQVDGLKSSHKIELECLQTTHARGLEESQKHADLVVANSKQRVWDAVGLQNEAVKQLTSTAQQLRETQEELKSVKEELEEAKAVVQRPTVGGNETLNALNGPDGETGQAKAENQSPEECDDITVSAQMPHSRPKRLGTGMSSPAYKPSSNDQSAKMPEPKPKLQEQYTQSTEAEQKAKDLQKQLDGAHSENQSLTWEISELRGELEVERNKTHSLTYHMQDEPAKTEPVDKQLMAKDDAYKKLEANFGNCLADNANLQSQLSHMQEATDFRVNSLEKKVAKKDEYVFDIRASRDAFLKAFKELKSYTQGSLELSELQTKFDEILALAPDEGQQLRLHLWTSENRISQLEQEVIFEKSKVEKAQDERTDEAEQVSRLQDEKQQADREIEKLKLRALEHAEIVEGKDAEIQAWQGYAQRQISQAASDLGHATTHGASSIVAKKNQELWDLQNLLTQRTQEAEELDRKVGELHGIRFWDTNSAYKATEADKSNASRMLVAEEQVANLLKELQDKNPTLSGLWEKWLETDASRMRQRQIADEATSRHEECQVFGRDLFNYLKALSENFNLSIPSGTPLAELESRIVERAAAILESDELEDQQPAALYPDLIDTAAGSQHLTDEESSGKTDCFNDSNTTAQGAQPIDETPNTKANCITTEMENKLGIYQKADGTWDIATQQQGAAATDKISSTDGTRGDNSKKEYCFSQAVSIKLALMRNLKQLAETVNHPVADDHQARVTAPGPRPPPGLNGAQEILQKNQERLAQVVDTPRQRSGAQRAQEAIQRSEERFADILREHPLPARRHVMYDTAQQVPGRLAQPILVPAAGAPGLDSSQYALQQNQERLSHMTTESDGAPTLQHPRPRIYAPRVEGYGGLLPMRCEQWAKSKEYYANWNWWNGGSTALSCASSPEPPTPPPGSIKDV